MNKKNLQALLMDMAIRVPVCYDDCFEKFLNLIKVFMKNKVNMNIQFNDIKHLSELCCKDEITQQRFIKMCDNYGIIKMWNKGVSDNGKNPKVSTGTVPGVN